MQMALYCTHNGTKRLDDFLAVFVNTFQESR